jgi:ribA/ribD-fused uncharacterized protein
MALFSTATATTASTPITATATTASTTIITPYTYTPHTFSTLKFCSPLDKYGEFSNYYTKAPIRLEEKDWATNEHYFQAKKFLDAAFQERIRQAQFPGQASDIGNSRSKSNPPLRKDWESVKLNIMETAIRAKFTQHANLRDLLIKTGDDILVEDNPHDYFWGCGADGSGQNNQGKLLMKVRAELLVAAAAAVAVAGACFGIGGGRMTDVPSEGYESS